jgi:hypothetical protein
MNFQNDMISHRRRIDALEEENERLKSRMRELELRMELYDEPMLYPVEQDSVQVNCTHYNLFSINTRICGKHIISG